jgi:hypothetical protein
MVTFDRKELISCSDPAIRIKHLAINLEAIHFRRVENVKAMVAGGNRVTYLRLVAEKL